MAHTFVDIGNSTRVDLTRLLEADGPPSLPDDGYPAVIEDSRHGYNVETADEILAYQLAWLAGECPPHPRPRTPVELTPDPEKREVIPYINSSRWVADCPQCGTSNWVWDGNPTMICLGDRCGYSFKVAWQLPQLRSEVIRVIAGWPQGNRNWDAHKGETVDELKLQGVLMQGVPAAERNGLIVAANIAMPDELISPQEYLDQLKAERAKGQ